MADNNKAHAEWIDIPDGRGGTQRIWYKDAEARAGIAQVASAIGFDTDYELVDLGLPSGTLWAKCNVGAVNETDYGNYYMYGKGATQYNSSDSAYTGNENPLDTEHDTATQVMGAPWHMPTQEQIFELIENTTFSWQTNFNGSGINGAKFTAANGNYIFLPAGGYKNVGNTYDVGAQGEYWGSTPNIPTDSSWAHSLLFTKNGASDSIESRSTGVLVRGVTAKSVTTELSQKADKVSGATNGNFAALDGNGNLVDSGHKHSDYLNAVTSVSGTTPSQALAPNKHYVFGTCTSLTVTFGTAVSNVVNEYSFEFDSGSTATTLTVPAGVIWQASPSIAANKHYEVNIKYNATTDKYYGIIVEF